MSLFMYLNFLFIGDEKCMASAVDQLLRIWDDYEYDAKSVAMTNGWLKE